MHVINWEGKKYYIPFDLEVIFPEEKTVTNPYSNISAELPWFAIAMYDLIKGSEHLEDYDMMQKGLDWFRKYFPKQYMTLLD